MQKFHETVERIISACPILAKKKYIRRHDTVCAELQCNTCKKIGGKLYIKQRCNPVPKFVSTGRERKVTVL